MAGFFFSYAFVKDNYKFFNDFGLDKPSVSGVSSSID